MRIHVPSCGKNTCWTIMILCTKRTLSGVGSIMKGKQDNLRLLSKCALTKIFCLC